MAKVKRKKVKRATKSTVWPLGTWPIVDLITMVDNGFDGTAVNGALKVSRSLPVVRIHMDVPYPQNVGVEGLIAGGFLKEAYELIVAHNSDVSQADSPYAHDVLRAAFMQ